MKNILLGIVDIFWYILTLPHRLYIDTWIFILLLAKRTVPKWLKEKYLSQAPARPVRLGSPAPYRR